MGGTTTQSPSGDVADVRDAVQALARSLKRIAVYRHARAQHASYLQPAAEQLRRALELRPAFDLELEPGALLFDGEAIYTEPPRERGFCYRLHRDGVRTLTFRRGLGLTELSTLAAIATADPAAEGGREDAVTELWKAELPHIGYTAISGYRMDTAAGGGAFRTLLQVQERVHAVLQRAGAPAAAAPARAPVWSEEQRNKRDASNWSELARRSAATILRIIERDHAGVDLEALEDAFSLLMDRAIDEQAPGVAAGALEAVRRAPGPHATQFREAVGRRLADPARIERMMKATCTERPSLLPAWLALLPADAGAVAVAILPLARDAAARAQVVAAALARFDSAASALHDLVRGGGALEARAVLAAAGGLPTQRKAELGASALGNPDPSVRVDGVALVCADPGTAPPKLAPLLASPLRAVRLAAAAGLGSCSTVAETATVPLVEAVRSAAFARTDREEQEAFYMALGRLGSTAAFEFLRDRLLNPRRRFLRIGRRSIEEQLLAVKGLVEDGRQRALPVLDQVVERGEAHEASVVAACRAAAQHLRTARTR